MPICVVELEDWWQSFRKYYPSCLENGKVVVDVPRCGEWRVESGDGAAGLLGLGHSANQGQADRLTGRQQKNHGTENMHILWLGGRKAWRHSKSYLPRLPYSREILIH